MHFIWRRTRGQYVSVLFEAGSTAEVPFPNFHPLHRGLMPKHLTWRAVQTNPLSGLLQGIGTRLKMDQVAHDFLVSFISSGGSFAEASGRAKAEMFTTAVSLRWVRAGSLTILSTWCVHLLIQNRQD